MEESTAKERAHMKMPPTRCQSFNIATAKDEFNGLSRLALC